MSSTGAASTTTVSQFTTDVRVPTSISSTSPPTVALEKSTTITDVQLSTTILSTSTDVSAPTSTARVQISTTDMKVPTSTPPTISFSKSPTTDVTEQSLKPLTFTTTSTAKVTNLRSTAFSAPTNTNRITSSTIHVTEQSSTPFTRTTTSTTEVTALDSITFTTATASTVKDSTNQLENEIDFLDISSTTMSNVSEVTAEKLLQVNYFIVKYK